MVSFGALVQICDGTADEVEINAALSALPGEGGKLTLLGGDFNIAAPIVVSTNVALEGVNTPYYTPLGVGTSIVNSGIGTDAIQLTGDHDITCSVRNLMISGSGATGNGITIEKCDNFILDNVIIDNVGAIGVEALGCWIGKIQNCEIRHNGSYGISLNLSGADSCTAIDIKNCHLGANTTYDLYIFDAFVINVNNNHFEHYTSTETFIYEQDSTVDVVNNTLSSSNAGTNLIVINGGGVLLDGNTFGGAHASGIQVGGASIRIVNNSMYLGATTEEIHLIDTTARAVISGNIIVTSDAFGIHANFNGPLEISNNQIICGGTGNADDAILVELAEGAIIDGNYITGARQFGIRSYAPGSLIANNTLLDGQRTQVYVAGNNCRITGNLIKDGVTEGILTTAAAIAGIIKDNEFDGNGTDISLNAASIDIMIYDKFMDLFMDVLGVTANHIRNNEDLSAAVPLTFTIDAQPDVPRTLSGHFDAHANITAYTIAIVGVDAKGRTITETMTEADGWDWETSNAFATITSITMSTRTGTGVGDTMDIGITDIVGLANRIIGTGDIYKIKKNNANEVVAGAQVSIVYDTYDMAVIGLAATDDFTIWYQKNLNLIV